MAFGGTAKNRAIEKCGHCNLEQGLPHAAVADAILTDRVLLYHHRVLLLELHVPQPAVHDPLGMFPRKL